MIIFLQFI